MSSKSKLKQLLDAGFDQSEFRPFPSRWKVRCSQCEALVINGLACHETGCPNSKRRNQDD